MTHITTANRRRRRILRAIDANPGASDRKIAEIAGVDHKTVAAHRRERWELPRPVGNFPTRQRTATPTRTTIAMSEVYREYFVYDDCLWWVDLARQLVASRAMVDIPVAEFAAMIGTLIEVDTSCTDVDLADPILVCDLAWPIDGRSRLVIDGWHRMNVAVSRGVATLPGRVLTAAEGLSVVEVEVDLDADPKYVDDPDFDPYFDFDEDEDGGAAVSQRLRVMAILELDAQLYPPDDAACQQWLILDILSDGNGLFLHSNEIGDEVGNVQIERIEVLR